MIQEFDWTGLGKISGFGGTYEKACQDMVKAGVTWLKEHPQAIPDAKVSPNILGVMVDTNKDMDDLQQAMCQACPDCTGVMMRACTNHVLYISIHGWDKYAEDMSVSPAPAEKIDADCTAGHPTSVENIDR